MYAVPARGVGYPLLPLVGTVVGLRMQLHWLHVGLPREGNVALESVEYCARWDIMVLVCLLDNTD